MYQDRMWAAHARKPGGLDFSEEHDGAAYLAVRRELLAGNEEICDRMLSRHAYAVQSMDLGENTDTVRTHFLDLYKHALKHCPPQWIPEIAHDVHIRLTNPVSDP